MKENFLFFCKKPVLQKNVSQANVCLTLLIFFGYDKS